MTVRATGESYWAIGKGKSNQKRLPEQSEKGTEQSEKVKSKRKRLSEQSEKGTEQSENCTE